jgi:hypothetical protein
MHGPINVKSPNNTSKWQMGFNSAFKGLSISVSLGPARDKHPSCDQTQNDAGKSYVKAREEITISM